MRSFFSPGHHARPRRLAPPGRGCSALAWAPRPGSSVPSSPSPSPGAAPRCLRRAPEIPPPRRGRALRPRPIPPHRHSSPPPDRPSPRCSRAAPRHVALPASRTRWCLVGGLIRRGLRGRGPSQTRSQSGWCLLDTISIARRRRWRSPRRPRLRSAASGTADPGASSGSTSPSRRTAARPRPRSTTLRSPARRWASASPPCSAECTCRRSRRPPSTLPNPSSLSDDRRTRSPPSGSGR